MSGKIHPEPLSNLPSCTVVAIAGSAGAVSGLCQILACLPADFPAPIIYTHHMNGSQPNLLLEVLQWRTPLKVKWAQPGDRLDPGSVYLCPPGFTLVACADGTLAHATTGKGGELFHRADRLFASVAGSFGRRAVVIVLSGGSADGSEGVCSVHERRGTVIVQDELSGYEGMMPRAALATGRFDFLLPLRDIAPAIVNLIRDQHSPATLRKTRHSLGEHPWAAASPQMQHILERLLTLSLKALGTDLGYIQVLDRANGDLKIAAQHGLGLNFLEHFRSVRSHHQSACGRAMRGHEPVSIPDVLLDPLFAAHVKIAAASGFRAVYSTPLIDRDGALFGMLSALFRDPRGLLPGEVRVLERFVNLSTGEMRECMCEVVGESR